MMEVWKSGDLENQPKASDAEIIPGGNGEERDGGTGV
jgi:hypothetical protein